MRSRLRNRATTLRTVVDELIAMVKSFFDALYSISPCALWNNATARNEAYGEAMEGVRARQRRPPARRDRGGEGLRARQRKERVVDVVDRFHVVPRDGATRRSEGTGGST